MFWKLIVVSTHTSTFLTSRLDAVPSMMLPVLEVSLIPLITFCLYQALIALIALLTLI